MAEHCVSFDINESSVTVPTGTLLTEAARLAAVDLNQPCGGQGRCGRCAVQVMDGEIRRRSTLRLSADDVEQGFALACQAVVEGDAAIHIPPQDQLERRLTSDRTAAQVSVPAGYDPCVGQTIRRISLTLPPPSMDDQTDDWSRLQRALRQQENISELRVSLPLLRRLGTVLRESGWQVTAVIDRQTWDHPHCPARLVDLRPGVLIEEAPLWGAAVDIGTTTVTVWLVDLLSGEVKVQVAEYNRQIQRGEDVISRIIYASKNSRDQELRSLVLETINGLIARACKRAQADPDNVVKATISGNSTMMHLLLGIPGESIRLSPFVTAVNALPTLSAIEVGLQINPEASVDCLPGIASYVGADISAGVLSSGMDDSDQVSLFMDIGTNGEIVLGSHEWLVACACSAGPAFEGAGVLHGMRATRGAIEEVWINGENFEPAMRVIGEVKPRGLCGSGLISLLSEMFLTGLVDKGGNINMDLAEADGDGRPRVRIGPHGPEYVIAWSHETQQGVRGGEHEDIVITRVDIDNLLRAKAAIYAGFTVLADGIGFPLEGVDRVLIGGSFGKYINVEKATQIGLLPDLGTARGWESFHFLGNTSVMGAYLALIDAPSRARIADIAGRMTYIELSADNAFYESFTSASFLPHTDLNRFPSVVAALQETHESS